MSFRVFIQFLLSTAIYLAVACPALGSETGPDNPLEGDMVRIPAGHFIFGTNKQDDSAEALSLGIPKPWYADEGPENKVFLKSFYIDRHEITNRRYKIYIDDLGAIPSDYWNGSQYPEGEAEYPVAWVTWFDAANFCQWAGKQLPTEKQWERAARGPEGMEYPWGNEFKPELANLSQKPGSKNLPRQVGSFPKGATPEGIHDLAGNVWEWMDSDYAPYKGSNYKSPGYGTGAKVLRGHSARDIGHFPGPSYMAALKQFARSGYRQYADPTEAEPDVGFRCASRDGVPAMKLASAAAASATNMTESSPNPTGSGSLKTSADPTLQSESAEDSETLNPFAAKPDLPESGILVLVFLSFVAGVFSFLSPCTLPILPAYFAVTAQADRARMGLMSMAFFFGLATLFVILGASASLLGQILRDYLFKITTLGGIAIAIFGLMTLFGKGFSGANFQGKPTSTFIGFFLFGATFALGWTPCVGPILSGVLILAASDKTLVQGMSLLFFYAVGLGLPLIVISTFFGHLSRDSWFWRILRGKGWDMQIGNQVIFLHTTNIFSGVLLIALGIALAMGYLTYLNSLIPIEIQIWFSEFEEGVKNWFM